jgi:hypothetical protein
MRSRDSSVGIEMGYILNGRGSISSRSRIIFFLIHSVQTGSGTHPASCPMGIRDYYPGDKTARPWSWPLISIWCRWQDWRSYASTLPYVFMAWCLINYAQGQIYHLYLCIVSTSWTHFVSYQGIFVQCGFCFNSSNISLISFMVHPKVFRRSSQKLITTETKQLRLYK